MPPDGRDGLLCHYHTADLDLALGGQQNPRDEFQQRGFPGPIGADYAYRFSMADMQADIIQGPGVVRISVGNVFKINIMMADFNLRKKVCPVKPGYRKNKP